MQPKRLAFRKNRYLCRVKPNIGERIMNGMSLQAEQNSLIRLILNCQDLDLLRRTKKNFTRKAELANDVPACVNEEMEPYMTKAEILEGLKQGLKEVKLCREGKLQLKTAEELLNEL